jgi:hypothetical protein
MYSKINPYMKELKLNPDGSMNIINPSKFFVMVIDWIGGRGPGTLSGKKYYFPEKHRDYYQLAREKEAWYGEQSKYLQYCLSDTLKYYSNRTENFSYLKIFEFDSKEEFENAKKRNLI